jgi:hypothetical protein
MPQEASVSVKRVSLSVSPHTSAPEADTKTLSDHRHDSVSSLRRQRLALEAEAGSRSSGSRGWL